MKDITDSINRKYQAFLSHHSDDKPQVEEIAIQLEKIGITTFLDKWHLIPGTPWQSAIEDALDQSTTCVVFVGSSGLGPWQNEEMRAAIDRRVQDKTKTYRVVPVLLPGAKRQQQSKLPPFMVATTWVEFSNGTLDDKDAFHRLMCGILGRPPLSGPGTVFYEGKCPFRGLQVFDVQDAEFFFGRDSQVDWMLDRLGQDFGSLEENRFLAVVGASGSGKSSLVRAGLIPALQNGKSRNGKGIANSTAWPVVIMKPGSEPLKALADSLWLNPLSKVAVPDPLAFADLLLDDERRLHATTGTALAGQPEHLRFVIVVDQFEELFTQFDARLDAYRDDLQQQKRVELERIAFVDNLLYAANIRGGRTVVILTLRADFYGRCSSFPQLAAAFGDAQELVPPLEDGQLRAAIQQPAVCCGLEFEPGLVELLMQDMHRQPSGALPLLQHSLYMLYQRRNGRRLTVEAYRDMGKLEGALEAHANRVYDEALTTPQQREICRRVMLMLTTPGIGVQDTRRRVARSQLGESNEVETVVHELVKARLITVSDSQSPQVEVAHEALIRGWKLLRQWLDADRASLRMLQELSDAAEDWHDHKRDPEYLLNGSRLLQAEEFRIVHPKELKGLPRANEFLDAALKMRDAAQLRRRSRLIALAIVGSLLLLAASISSIFFYWEQDRATRNEREARRVAAESFIQNGIAAIQLENDHFGAIYSFTRAMLSAGSDSPAPRRSARNLISSSSRALPILALVHEVNFSEIAFSPDGARVLTKGSTRPDGEIVQLWDVLTGEPLGEPIVGNYMTMAFSPDSKRFLILDLDEVRQWDGMSGLKLSTSIKPRESSSKFSRIRFETAAFGFDSTRLLTLDTQGTSELWDADTGERLGKQIEHGTSRPDIIKFSPDGTRIISFDQDGIRLRDGRTGTPLCGPIEFYDGFKILEFSPDSKRFAIITWDGRLYLFDGMNGELLGQVTTHKDTVNSLAFSLDGNRILTGSDDKTARLWNGLNGIPLGEPMTHEDSVMSVAFSSDGTRLFTGSADGKALLWDGINCENLGELIAVPSKNSAAHWSPDFAHVLVYNNLYENSPVQLWKIRRNGRPGIQNKHRDHVGGIACSPDGTRVLTVIKNKDKTDSVTLQLTDSLTGERVGHGIEYKADIETVTFSPSGNRFVIGCKDGSLKICDGFTGEPLNRNMKHFGEVYLTKFSSDGTRVISLSRDGTGKFWDSMTGESLGKELEIGCFGPFLVFSPDGTRVLLQNKEGDIQMWDVITGVPRGEPIKHDEWTDAIFSPDGERILTVSATNLERKGGIRTGGILRLWDGHTGSPLSRMMPPHSSSFEAVAFSPDGLRVLTGGRHHTAQFWDGKTLVRLGEPMKHAEEPLAEVCSVTFSPDGKSVLTGGHDMTARLWSSLTGAPLAKPMNHAHWVLGATFSPDGNWILTHSQDGTVQLWDAFTGMRLALLRQPQKGVIREISFSHDSAKIFSRDYEKLGEGTIHVWEVDPPAIDDPERIWLSTEVRTGWTIENGSRRVLTPQEHRAKKKQLDALGGDCLNRSMSDLSEAEKLELRTPLHMPTAVSPTPTQQ